MAGRFGAAFAVAEYRAIWAAGGLSMVGDQLARVALVVLVYDNTHSAALTGLTFALTLVPSFVGGVFLSGLADRLPRRRVMLTADLLRAAMIVPVAIPGMPFPVLCVLVAGVSLLNAPFRAGEQALLADVLPQDGFLAGMAIRNITNQSAQVLGFAGGGLLLAVIGPYWTLSLDALSFLVSAILLRAGVRARPAALNPAHRATPGGFALLRNDPGLRALLLIGWLTGMFIVYEGLAGPYNDELGGTTVTLGLLLAADPVGSVIGAFVFGRFVPGTAQARGLALMCVASGVPLLLCLLHPGLVASAALFIVAGAFGTATYMQTTASIVRGVHDSRRAQVLGLAYAGMMAAQGLSPFVAGLVADRVGAANAVGWFGLIGLLIAAPVAVAWRRATTSRPDIWLPAPESGADTRRS
ncbi:MFS transporter [Kutzneria sp. NPDC051319]|uniref:MFS transporter n=1 Tax=Kutzneria sp. NPDC051319 TaxID=3155047 RepID=UPI00343F4783